MSQTPNLFGTAREWVIDLAIITAMGVFLGLIGPYGSYYGGGTAIRIAYWTANMWIGFIVLSLTVRLAVRAAAGLDLPIWFTLSLGIATGAVPLALVLELFSGWFWPPSHRSLTPIFIQYGQVLTISEPLGFGFYYLVGRGWSVTPALGRTPAPAAAAGEGGRFLDRLPPRLGRDLLCLQMEDHYVRAHTLKGSELILTPLKTAINELGGPDGMQVHRSWWVASAAVAGRLTRGRNHFLVLTNGLEVPVSRASVAKLRAKGWLQSVEA